MFLPVKCHKQQFKKNLLRVIKTIFFFFILLSVKWFPRFLFLKPSHKDCCVYDVVRLQWFSFSSTLNSDRPRCKSQAGGKMCDQISGFCLAHMYFLQSGLCTEPLYPNQVHLWDKTNVPWRIRPPFITTGILNAAAHQQLSGFDDTLSLTFLLHALTPNTHPHTHMQILYSPCAPSYLETPTLEHQMEPKITWQPSLSHFCHAAVNPTVSWDPV